MWRITGKGIDQREDGWLEWKNISCVKNRGQWKLLVGEDLHGLDQLCQRDFFVSPIICQNFFPKSNKIPHYNKNNSIPRQSAARANFYSAAPRLSTIFSCHLPPPPLVKFFTSKKTDFTSLFLVYIAVKKTSHFPSFQSSPPIPPSNMVFPQKWGKSPIVGSPDSICL